MSVIVDEEDYLAHYGILRKSGRYPWGSGKDESTRAQTFLGMVADCRKQGLTDKQIAEGFGMTTTDLRAATTIANNAAARAKIVQAEKLRARGWSNVAIGKEMGIGESSVRALLEPGRKERNDILTATSEMLRQQVAEKKFIDVGKGVELHRGISAEKLKAAVKVLETEGYEVHKIKVRQLGTGKDTQVKVLCPPGTTFGELVKHRADIQQITMYSSDRGLSYDNIKPPISIDSKRVKVRYAEEGGTLRDGVIQVRPGVKDTSLGNATYAQVRVAVDGTHYLKGMAMRGDPKDFPPGVDLIFNTNKKNTGNKLDAMKPMSNDPKDPFGATIDHQIQDTDSFGRKHVTSVMNIVNAEGRWDEWNRSLSSQMLSKQSQVLAKKQLDLVKERKRRELDEIMSISNPTLREHLLGKYAESTDAAAVHLKAAALPRQATKVILPLTKISEKEIYAPTFEDGERVVLVRFPHGGTFEIPELTVNNRVPEGKSVIGPKARDAVGIHPKVAERLSGADFDGDTVLVIPNKLGKIKSTPPLEGLKDFDPKMYKLPETAPKMSARTKGIEMGKVSNLITDMTIGGAPFPEIERAVKHSMVVIDAEKHHLDYRQSAIDNGIAALTKKYQKKNGGASTVISNSGANAKIEIPERKLRSAKDGGPIDAATGKLVYVPTGRTYTKTVTKTNKRTGEVTTVTKEVPYTEKVAKLASTDDARTYLSKNPTPIEIIYANHSNALKDMANEARKATLSVKAIERSPSAAKTYAPEVKRLDAALNLALRNAPLERQAQIIGNAIYRQKLQANPNMDEGDKKKASSKALEEARIRTGAKKDQIEISPREWEAIQAGAISPSKLKDILDNTDTEKLKELAMPREAVVHDPAMRARAAELLRGDQYTQAEVANHLGISVSTLVSLLSGE
ncbi:helix-turn-helix DNA-binding domain protein [Streptomyces phage ClubPenguin]|nr:helix-turn-helix DNA-binding domain protein [Streptomyces phage ClubPenguin]